MSYAAVRPRHQPDSTIADNPASQAYELLHWGFVALPAIAGLDKFTHVLADWDLYLAPGVPHAFGTVTHPFMIGVGIFEIGMALLVAIRPRIGAGVVATWLAAIIIDLLMLGAHYDVLLRDLGLVLAACALERLALAREHGDLTVHTS
jgi:hypothetical protein